MRRYGDIVEYLESDGALRDFYIEATSSDDWNRLLAAIPSIAPKHEFTHKGCSTLLPRSLADIENMQKEDPTTLHITIADAVVNCHFFCQDEIEMDFRPEDFRNPVKWEQLTAFLQKVVNVVGKPGIITMENWKDTVIDRLEPKQKAERIHGTARSAPPVIRDVQGERNRMIHEIAITFTGSTNPVLLPVTDVEFNRLRNLLSDRDEPLTFVELDTVFGQRVSANMGAVRLIRFLLEPHEAFDWSSDDLAPSRQEPEDGSEPDWDDILWDVDIFLQGQVAPLSVVGASGHDWVTVSTSLDRELQYLIIPDEDNEDVAMPLSKINMIIGTETKRYTEKQLDLVRTIMHPEQPH